MNGVMLNLKVMRFDARPANVIKVRNLDIDNTTAFQADQVMMLIEPGVEARRGTGVAGPGHESERVKRSEDTVNRHTGDLGKFAPNGAVKLFGSRMIRAVQNSFKDGPPLRSHRQTGSAMRSEEALHSFFFFCATHLAEMSICT
jgi:hypothetical protein